MIKKVAIVGGGMAGCAAAIAARKTGVKVALLEKSDRLGGLSLVAGTFGANGQLTAMKEAEAMGATEIPNTLHSLVIHSNVQMSGKSHVSLYDCRKSAFALECMLSELGIDFKYKSRVCDVKKSGDSISGIILDNKEYIDADAFVDATGTSGPVENCVKFGNGCVDCSLRCPTFGGRVSLSAKAGVPEKIGVRNDGQPGTVTAAFTIVKETMSKEIQDRLARDGSFLYKVPKAMVRTLLTRIGLVPTSVTDDYAESLTLEDNGYMNVIGIPYMTMEEIKQLPGFENAQFVQPYTAWEGNSIRYMSVTPRNNALKVDGINNLFVAGDKIGGQPNGVTEAYVTGTLAGHNAGRCANNMQLLEIAQTTSIGDFIAFTASNQENMSQRYSLMWGPYFERMQRLGLYTTDVNIIKDRVEKAKLSNVFCL